MKSSAQSTPVEKTIVLVGAGNAHLQFVKRWAMRPVPGVAVTLVNESAVIPYSAMVPGHLAADYTWDDITIDLVRLCQSAGVRLVNERVTALDPARRQVCFAGRPALVYDAISLGLGSIPARPPNAAADDNSLLMRPLAELCNQMEALATKLKVAPRPFHLVVVGGGASGCELALAIHKRLGRHEGFHLTLLQENARLVPQLPAKVGRLLQRTFEESGIAIRTATRVIGAEVGSLLLDDGKRVTFDAVLWATNAAPPPVLRVPNLKLDDNGFLLVHDTLQSVTDPAVFGTGDCVSFPAYPNLPKNGVHAVREGTVLFNNLIAFLREQPLRRFRPQWFCLSILNTADGMAILNYGPFAWKSRWARWLKERIDRRWIAMFRRLQASMSPTTTAEEPSTMRCGGCGSKISSDVLSAVLKRLDLPDNPRVLLGTRAGEDAAVYRVRPELFGSEPNQLVEVQTVDYFKCFIDDPYLFGRIAALNSVSDLHAMNARPFSALAIATLPYARGPVQEAQLYELLAGAVESFRQLGVVLTGGHTTEGSDLALGFSVTGYAEEDRLFRKSNLRPGDCLILTKPLGSGALLAAWMRGECRATWFEALMDKMLLPNAAAAAVFAAAGVTACTDVTGFGLAGHLLEMLDASRVSVRLSMQDVPLYEGFTEVVDRGIVSTLHLDNAKMACRIQGPAALPAWLFDPQTSGGLLGAVPSERVAEVVRRLCEAGYRDAVVIGTALPLGAPTSFPPFPAPTLFCVHSWRSA